MYADSPHETAEPARTEAPLQGAPPCWLEFGTWAPSSSGADQSLQACVKLAWALMEALLFCLDRHRLQPHTTLKAGLAALHHKYRPLFASGLLLTSISRPLPLCSQVTPCMQGPA